MTVVEISEAANAYLEAQRHSVDDASFGIIMQGQCRSLRTRILECEGVTQECAADALVKARDGHWAGIHLNSIATALDAAVQKAARAEAIGTERKPQNCENVELFFTAKLWELAHDQTAHRNIRYGRIADFLMTMDLTTPGPKCKHRLVGIMAIADPWMQASTTNAKTALDDFTEVLRKRRTPKAECTRAHIVDYPRTPEIACSVIDGFAERVYGSDEPGPDPPFSTADID